MTTTFTARRGHLSAAHPLADVAAQHCEDHIGAVRRNAIDQVACGACWERAIRDDERFAVEFDLPRELAPDPLYVDDIAVERACRGEQLALTPVERAVAVRALHTAGLRPSAIANRLHMSTCAVGTLLNGIASAVPFVPASTSTVSAEVA